MKSIIFALFCLVALVYSRANLYTGELDKVVPDQYIVVMKSGITVQQRDAHIAKLLETIADRVGSVVEEIAYKYDHTIIGYAAKFNMATVDMLLEDPMIDYIEFDQIVTLDEVQEPDGQEQQIMVDPAAWGLRRIDQKPDFYFQDDTYTYFASAGTGVDTYIIDTGILLTHQDFQGRAIAGANTVPGEGANDCNGHGTHVASTAGGWEYGVAKKTTLIAVKVLGCGGSGTWAGVISGVDWTTQSFQDRKKPSVANMSLGGSISTALDQAVAASIRAGVVYAVAAGNNNANACSFSPANVATAITVNASWYTLQGTSPALEPRSSFSNFGTCTNIFAPGQNIKAAWIGSNTATNTISGTSMASPHVCGAVAVFLGHAHAIGAPIPNPETVMKYMQAVAIPNKITNPGAGSPNLVLYSPNE